MITALPLAEIRHIASAGANGYAAARMAVITGPEFVLAMGTISIGGALLYPLLRAIARRIEGREVASGSSREMFDRLERIERGLDAVALEVERISENQRFVTQVMSKREPERALERGHP